MTGFRRSLPVDERRTSPSSCGTTSFRRKKFGSTPRSIPSKRSSPRSHAAGYHVITLEALRAHLVHGAPLPSKPLALTFDDNGHGIYEYAFPLLRQYRFPATMFVHTNFVGTTTTKRHTTWPQLVEMSRSGIMTIQSLTANHPPDLRALSDAAVVHELTLSRTSLAVSPRAQDLRARLSGRQLRRTARKTRRRQRLRTRVHRRLGQRRRLRQPARNPPLLRPDPLRSSPRRRRAAALATSRCP